MLRKLRPFIFTVIGLVSLVLSIRCFSFDSLDYESMNSYGGDAYTGIQNAAAMTSKNVKELAEIVQFGFGSILLVVGLSLAGYGLTDSVEKKNI